MLLMDIELSQSSLDGTAPDHRLWSMQGGVTALWWACKEGLLGVAQVLLAAGAAIGISDSDVSRSRYWFMVLSCYYSMVLSLLLLVHGFCRVGLHNLQLRATPSSSLRRRMGTMEL
jgi:hypothetical protein